MLNVADISDASLKVIGFLNTPVTSLMYHNPADKVNVSLTPESKAASFIL